MDLKLHSVSSSDLLRRYTPAIAEGVVLHSAGRVSQAVGLIIESDGPQATIGEVCILRNRRGEEICRSEIVGFRGNKILSMALGDVYDVEPGAEIVSTGKKLNIALSDELLGRVVDGIGHPLDGLPPPEFPVFRPVYAQPPNPLLRKKITEPLSTGVRAIDGLLTIGKGQRIGVFAGSGVGKSTLMGMIAKNTDADVNVIALVGERGREVRDFIEESLGEEGRRRSVVVVATSDMPPLLRARAPLTATTIAEYFRDKGLNVMLMMDSVTRLALAQREIGLSTGEPPTTRGYPPSVFALLPKLMERAGTAEKGSITALYTVLVEGDDMNEPIADAARGILDGHFVLSRKLAALGHYPALDILESVSRVMKDVVDESHRKQATAIKSFMAAYRQNEDLISVGAYTKGGNSALDKAVAMQEPISNFLRQNENEAIEYYETISKLQQLGNA